MFWVVLLLSYSQKCHAAYEFVQMVHLLQQRIPLSTAYNQQIFLPALAWCGFSSFRHEGYVIYGTALSAFENIQYSIQDVTEMYFPDIHKLPV